MAFLFQDPGEVVTIPQENISLNSNFIGLAHFVGDQVALVLQRPGQPWTTLQVGRKVDKVNLTDFGRILKQLGVELSVRCS